MMTNKTTFTETKKKVLSTLTAACCALSLAAFAPGSNVLSDIGFGNAVVANAASATNYRVILDATSDGKNLVTNAEYYSPNKEYYLKFQSDGNLVLYTKGGKPIWSPQIAKKGGKTCRLQKDGNLVVYNASGTAVWHTETHNNNRPKLYIYNDGRISIYSDAKNKFTWSSNAKVDNVKLIAQETNVWCSAACEQMVLNKFGINSKQSDLINKTRSGPSPDAVVNRALNPNGLNYQYYNIGNPRLYDYYKTLQSSLLKGNPVIVNIALPNANNRFGYSAKDGHYIVVTSVYQDAGGQYWAHVNDPYSKIYANQGIKSAQSFEIPLNDLLTVNKNRGWIIYCP